MGYEGDAFISYAHLDNRALSDDQPGWVASFQRVLETRVTQLIGREARVWWDAEELRGNDVFPDVLANRLRNVAALVPILSPSYLNSRWGRRELEEFCRAAEKAGGLRIGDKARIFKVLKTSVPLAQHPPELIDFIGYEFYRIEPETGRVRELLGEFGPETEQEFLLKLDDLAHDLCQLLQRLHESHATPFVQNAPTGSVYVAETTNDLKPQRDALRRSLQQQGYAVLPSRAMPLASGELENVIRQDLSTCRMSIHLFGATYGLVPEGAAVSLPEIQHALAAERSAHEHFSRLLWIPKGITVADERQRRLLDRLRLDEGMRLETDLLETSFEELGTMVMARLQAPARPTARTSDAAGSDVASLYLVHDQRDAAAVSPFTDLLFQSFEVMHPQFEGDEREVRQAHEEALRVCDGVLLFYGEAGEPWLRRKLTEIQRSPGTGRTKAPPEVCVCQAPPRTPVKERFRTHYATVVAQWHGCDPVALQPFLNAVRARGRESAR